MKYDPIFIEVFKQNLVAVAEEMGAVLKRSSLSPNIKERQDFSCAVFTCDGEMVSQASHIPVHLGAMPLSVREILKEFPRVYPGDVFLLNDPFRGGTHLPDVTCVAPVFMSASDKDPVAYIANRAHHADIGGISPGSMPLSNELYQEGLIIPPLKLFNEGTLNSSIMQMILSNVRTPHEREGDLMAQYGSIRRGISRFRDLVQRFGLHTTLDYMNYLLQYAEKLTREFIRQLPNGNYAFVDYLDDDGQGNKLIPIHVKVTIENDEMLFDFTGSAPQQKGNVNAVFAITLSAVNYALRCILGSDIPHNNGYMRPIRVIAPEGTVVNALPPAAVAAGNVETSQRIADVIFGALAEALPDRIPAASQGTMNNLTLGGYDTFRNRAFTYYETIGGGAGASGAQDGASALHTHMTNTLNTPIEVLEHEYPFQITAYRIRRGSGGQGKYCGGDGIIRRMKILCPTQVSILSERRVTPPYGLNGGAPGSRGRNLLISKNGGEKELPGKFFLTLSEGDELEIQTPGGGGWGKPITDS